MLAPPVALYIFNVPGFDLHSGQNSRSMGKVQKKEGQKLKGVSFAFTHTYTLEKLTVFLFFPKRTWKFLKNAQKHQKKSRGRGVGVL